MAAAAELSPRQKTAQVFVQLRQARARQTDAEVKQSDLAREIGVTQPYISRIEGGLVNYETMPLGTVEKIAKAYRFTLADWPSILRGEMPSRATKQHVGDEVKGGLRFVNMPVRAIAQAGWPAEDLDELDLGEELVPAEEFKDGMLVLEVDGESMNGGEVDDLRPSDRVYVDQHDIELREGKVYVVRIIGNGIVVKRVRFFYGEPWLTSDNPDYPPLKPTEAKVIGRVYYRQPKGSRM